MSPCLPRPQLVARSSACLSINKDVQGSGYALNCGHGWPTHQSVRLGLSEKQRVLCCELLVVHGVKHKEAMLKVLSTIHICLSAIGTLRAELTWFNGIGPVLLGHYNLVYIYLSATYLGDVHCTLGSKLIQLTYRLIWKCKPIHIKMQENILCPAWVDIEMHPQVQTLLSMLGLQEERVAHPRVRDIDSRYDSTDNSDIENYDHNVEKNCVSLAVQKACFDKVMVS